MPPRPSSGFPRVHAYLFFGDQVEKLLGARDQVLSMFLEDEEQRLAGLTEIVPSGNSKAVSLEKELPSIVADLSTRSFIAESTKVVVIHTPAEIYGAARKPKARAKAAPVASASPASSKKRSKGQDDAPPRTAEDEEDEVLADMLHWFEKGLLETGNVVVLLGFEDQSDSREVNDRHPLVELIARIGYSQMFRDKKLFFDIEDAILRRDLPGWLRSSRDLWRPNKSDTTVYGATLRALRFLLQAAILHAETERGRRPTPEQLEAMFPASPQTNLFKAAQFIRDKYGRAKSAYRTQDLLEAFDALLEVHRALRPAPGDSVPDAQPMLERIVVRLMSSPPPR